MLWLGLCVSVLPRGQDARAKLNGQRVWNIFFVVWGDGTRASERVSECVQLGRYSEFIRSHYGPHRYPLRGAACVERFGFVFPWFGRLVCAVLRPP